MKQCHDRITCKRFSLDDDDDDAENIHYEALLAKLPSLVDHNLLLEVTAHCNFQFHYDYSAVKFKRPGAKINLVGRKKHFIRNPTVLCLPSTHQVTLLQIITVDSVDC